MDIRNIECIPKCLAIAFRQKSNSAKHISGEDLFKRFVDANNYCFWNINLKDVLGKCLFVGHIHPFCLLISTEDLNIQSLKLAYEKRLLRAPELFSMHFMGDVDPVRCGSIVQSPFVPLDEALCYVIFDLNLKHEASTFELICCRLAEWYPGLDLPSQFLILASLRNLVDAGQVYFTGYGYNIMTTERIPVAQWLGEQDLVVGLALDNSLSGESVVDRADMRTSVNGREDNDRGQMDTAPVLDQSEGRNKAPSAVWQFFAKLRRRRRKSHLPSLTASTANVGDIHDDSQFFSFQGSRPRFYSSNLECSTRIPTMTPSGVTADTNDGLVKPEWLSRTSLESVSGDKCSSSTTVVINNRKGRKSKCKGRGSRNKCSLESDRQISEDHQGGDVANDNVQEDSGIHSTYGSGSKAIVRLPLCNHRNKSVDFESDPMNTEQGSPTSLSVKQKTKTNRVFHRSFSFKLSSASENRSLDVITEKSRRISHDDKHVAFKDNVDC